MGSATHLEELELTFCPGPDGWAGDELAKAVVVLPMSCFECCLMLFGRPGVGRQPQGQQYPHQDGSELQRYR